MIRAPGGSLEGPRHRPRDNVRCPVCRTVLKTGRGASPSWVRIPPHPPAIPCQSCSASSKQIRFNTFSHANTSLLLELRIKHGAVAADVELPSRRWLPAVRVSRWRIGEFARDETPRFDRFSLRLLFRPPFGDQAMRVAGLTGGAGLASSASRCLLGARLYLRIHLLRRLQDRWRLGIRARRYRLTHCGWRFG